MKDNLFETEDLTLEFIKEATRKMSRIMWNSTEYFANITINNDQQDHNNSFPGLFIEFN